VGQHIAVATNPEHELEAAYPARNGSKPINLYGGREKMTLGKLTHSFLVLISFIGLNNGLIIGSDSKADPNSPDSVVAFQKLKNLNGEWTGTAESKQGPAAAVSYHLTANGNTLMETLFPGTDHEMISMYYLDGKDLVLTHYCAMGKSTQNEANPK
jgi:hypothetical protein